MFRVFQFSQHVLAMNPKFPRNLLKVVHYGKNYGDILNVPLWNIFGTLFQFILNFPGLEHRNHTAGEITKEIVNEPLGKIRGTFFWKIYGFPTLFPMGTSQSHDLVHFECYKHFLCWEHCKEISLENSKCTCNVLGGFGAGSLSMSL